VSNISPRKNYELKKDTPLCPECQRKLRYKGEGWYECDDPQCGVIKVKVMDSQIVKVKRSAVMEVNNDW